VEGFEQLVCLWAGINPVTEEPPAPSVSPADSAGHEQRAPVDNAGSALDAVAKFAAAQHSKEEEGHSVPSATTATGARAAPADAEDALRAAEAIVAAVGPGSAAKAVGGVEDAVAALRAGEPASGGVDMASALDVGMASAGSRLGHGAPGGAAEAGCRRPLAGAMARAASEGMLAIMVALEPSAAGEEPGNWLREATGAAVDPEPGVDGVAASGPHIIQDSEADSVGGPFNGDGDCAAAAGAAEACKQRTGRASDIRIEMEAGVALDTNSQPAGLSSSRITCTGPSAPCPSIFFG
jgi:hypothetical protein